MRGAAARCLLVAATALNAVGCGGSAAPDVSVRWDNATYVLPAAGGCACAWIVAAVDGQVRWPDRVDPLDAGVPGGPTASFPDPNRQTCGATGSLNPVEALQAGVTRFCGQGVAGSWRFRATVAAGGTSASADATVVVP